MQNTNNINNTNKNDIVNDIDTLFQNSAQLSFSATQVHAYSMLVLNKNKSRSEPGNAPRIGIGHREVVCQK